MRLVSWRSVRFATASPPWSVAVTRHRLPPSTEAVKVTKKPEELERFPQVADQRKRRLWPRASYARRTCVLPSTTSASTGSTETAVRSWVMFTRDDALALPREPVTVQSVPPPALDTAKSTHSPLAFERTPHEGGSRLQFSAYGWPRRSAPEIERDPPSTTLAPAGATPTEVVSGTTSTVTVAAVQTWPTAPLTFMMPLYV